MHAAIDHSFLMLGPWDKITWQLRHLVFRAKHWTYCSTNKWFCKTIKTRHGCFVSSQVQVHTIGKSKYWKTHPRG